jgi:hypothetical protein
MSLFTPAHTAAMRDHTKRRNYSEEAEQFRREHAIRRDWGLEQRHARKLRRLYGSTAAAWAAFHDRVEEVLSQASIDDEAGPPARSGSDLVTETPLARPIPALLETAPPETVRLGIALSGSALSAAAKPETISPGTALSETAPPAAARPDTVPPETAKPETAGPGSLCPRPPCSLPPGPRPSRPRPPCPRPPCPRLPRPRRWSTPRSSATPPRPNCSNPKRSWLKRRQPNRPETTATEPTLSRLAYPNRAGRTGHRRAQRGRAQRGRAQRGRAAIRSADSASIDNPLAYSAATTRHGAAHHDPPANARPTQKPRLTQPANPGPTAPDNQTRAGENRPLRPATTCRTRPATNTQESTRKQSIPSNNSAARGNSCRRGALLRTWIPERLAEWYFRFEGAPTSADPDAADMPCSRVVTAGVIGGISGSVGPPPYGVCWRRPDRETLRWRVASDLLDAARMCRRRHGARGPWPEPGRAP